MVAKATPKTVRKNLLDLEHGQLINYTNILLIVEATFLITLWLGSFVSDLPLKAALTIISLPIALFGFLHLSEDIQKIRKKIEGL